MGSAILAVRAGEALNGVRVVMDYAKFTFDESCCAP